MDELPGATDIVEGAATGGQVWCERESQVQTCKELQVLEKQLGAPEQLMQSIAHHILVLTTNLCPACSN